MKKKVGQSLVELLLIIALSAVVLPSLLTGLVSSRQAKPQQNQRLQATTILKETVEAVRSAREKGWNTFAVNGTYNPIVSGSEWILPTGPATINGFTRQVVIADTCRNSSSIIVPCGGTDPIDPSTKKVTVTISWTMPSASSVTSTLYLTRYLENITTTETTQAHFNAGTKTGVTVQATKPSGVPDDGEVLLGSGGQGQWCAPNLSITALDLPKNGVANAVTAFEGNAFAGTGDNASGVSFAKVNISNPPHPSPPAATLGYTFDGYKTNGVYGDVNYAYLATDTNAEEVVIIDLNSVINGKYQKAGYFNAPVNGDGNSVWVSGTTGYVTEGNILYNYDLSNMTTCKNSGCPIKDPDGVPLAGTGNRVVVVGDYAYVATSDTSKQLQIVSLSNQNNLTIVGNLSSGLNDQPGKDVYVNITGSRAYVATSASASKKEFFIVDVTNKTSPVPVPNCISYEACGYETNGMSPKGVTVVTGNKAIIVGTGAEEYQAIDITTESNPTHCGGLNIDTGVNGVSSVLEQDGDAYSYIITGDATTEFKIIEGGPGGQYASSGDYTSSTFDPGGQTNFNRLSATISKPSQTDITMQVAVADAINNSCDGVIFNFVGPDKNSSTFYTSTDNTTIVGAIPIDDNVSGYENPGRCFRYKAFFSTSDSTQTPVLYETTVNYSP